MRRWRALLWQVAALAALDVARGLSAPNHTSSDLVRRLRTVRHGSELAEWVRSQHQESDLTAAAWERARHELAPAPPGFNGSRPFPVYMKFHKVCRRSWRLRYVGLACDARRSAATRRTPAGTRAPLGGVRDGLAHTALPEFLDAGAAA